MQRPLRVRPVNNGTRIGAAASIVIAQMVSLEYFNVDPAVAIGFLFGAGTMIALDIADDWIWQNLQIAQTFRNDNEGGNQ